MVHHYPLYLKGTSMFTFLKASFIEAIIFIGLISIFLKILYNLANCICVCACMHSSICEMVLYSVPYSIPYLVSWALCRPILVSWQTWNPLLLTSTVDPKVYILLVLNPYSSSGRHPGGPHLLPPPPRGCIINILVSGSLEIYIRIHRWNSWSHSRHIISSE